MLSSLNKFPTKVLHDVLFKKGEHAIIQKQFSFQTFVCACLN